MPTGLLIAIGAGPKKSKSKPPAGPEIPRRRRPGEEEEEEGLTFPSPASSTREPGEMMEEMAESARLPSTSPGSSTEESEENEIGHFDPLQVHLHGPEESCGLCQYFKPPFSCREVAGPLTAQHWCILFTPSMEGQTPYDESLSPSSGPSEPSTQPPMG